MEVEEAAQSACLTDVQAPGSKEELLRMGHHPVATIRRVMAEELRPDGAIAIYHFN